MPTPLDGNARAGPSSPLLLRCRLFTLLLWTTIVAGDDGKTDIQRPALKSSTETRSILDSPAESDIELSQTPSDVGLKHVTLGHFIYTAVALLCMLLVATMLGCRAKHLRFNNWRAMNLIRLLVVTLYILDICLIFAAGLLESGLGLHTKATCHAGILVCLIFYVGSKIVMYIFLTERAHVLRAPYLRRSCDWIWVASMIVIALGFGSISAVAFIYPVRDISMIDGKCRIGLPLKVTIPLLTYDIMINFGLTAVFIHLLRPILRFGGRRPSDASGPVVRGLRLRSFLAKITLQREERATTPPDEYNSRMNSTLLKAVERLVWKSVIGACLVLLPTVANLGLLTHMRGREQGWLCFTICTLDVTFAVCVVHWLTVEPMEVDGNRAIPANLGSANSGSVSAGIALETQVP